MMTDKKDPTSSDSEYDAKVKEAKIVRKIVFFMLLFFTLIIAIGVISGYFYVKSALQPVDNDNDTPVEFEVPMGSSTSNIAQILEENGLIKNSKVFRFYVKFKNYSEFQAGDYALAPSLSMEEIIQELHEGKVVEEPIYRFTVPEGKSVEEIANLVDEKLSIPKEDFLDVVQDEKFLKELINKYPTLLTDDIATDDVIIPLEGYLYAGTYDIFEEKPTAKTVVTMMVEQTKKVLDGHVDEIEKSDLNTHEILTLASIVERESKFEKDRPKVAQVFYNRMENGMKLQSDITAAYANGEHKIVMTYDDIGVDSPYNTYVQEGLPPGPIASPSLEAIQAVLKPQTVLKPEEKDFDYLFFYARPNGKTYYTKSLDEHNEIVDKYRQEWYDLENEKNKK